MYGANVIRHTNRPLIITWLISFSHRIGIVCLSALGWKIGSVGMSTSDWKYTVFILNSINAVEHWGDFNGICGNKQRICNFSANKPPREHMNPCNSNNLTNMWNIYYSILLSLKYSYEVMLIWFQRTENSTNLNWHFLLFLEQKNKCLKIISLKGTFIQSSTHTSMLIKKWEIFI